jgi:hypothetical protein
LRDAEICQFDAAGFVQKNVSKFDVAVGPVVLVAMREGAQDLLPEDPEAREREGAAARHFGADGATPAELEDQKPVLLDHELLVEANDVRMIECEKGVNLLAGANKGFFSFGRGQINDFGAELHVELLRFDEINTSKTTMSDFSKENIAVEGNGQVVELERHFENGSERSENLSKTINLPAVFTPSGAVSEQT